ncbi:Hypothetical protein Minf_1158 [Methylacidiphilum infernorum V4]|uniref:Lipoprotein n=2 Tax=Candidatus Methylacidiphilum infernorum TaxID=511746 RepID=B3DV60_METI4|nr:Hypothetical protein Minf_1158 [Methylacidiphilum infernorum V4]
MMGNMDSGKIRSGFFLSFFFLAGCSLHSSFPSRFPVNLECQKIDYLISASQLRVMPSKEGFVLSTPLVYANKKLLPIGTEFRAQRAFPQALPPRYTVDGLRINPQSPFVPATGVVFYSEGKYWLTLSSLYVPKNR